MASFPFHVSKEVAERLVSDRLSNRLRRSVVAHLLSNCTECIAVLQSVMHPAQGDDYSDMLRRLGLSVVVAQGRVAEERVHAKRLWPELEQQSPELRMFMVKHLAEFQTWGIYDLAIERVKALSRNDPIQAVDLAELAVTIAELLDPEFYGAERRADLLGAAYTTLGNTKRIAGDFDGAASALREAEGCLKQGTGDFYERANLISIRSSLVTDLGRFEEAVEMLFPAVRLAKRLRDEQLEGKLLIQQSSTIGFVDPILALELAEKGVVKTQRESSLELTGRYLIAYWTSELGDPAGALAAIDPYRYLFSKFSDVFWTGRLLNLEGSIARVERDFERSEFFFRQLVELYGEADFEFDLALACLELASVLSAQGKIHEAVGILQDTYLVLLKWRLHGDILRSWLIVQEGVRQHSIQETAFRDLEMVLRRKWHRKG